MATEGRCTARRGDLKMGLCRISPPPTAASAIPVRLEARVRFCFFGVRDDRSPGVIELP